MCSFVVFESINWRIWEQLSISNFNHIYSINLVIGITKFLIRSYEWLNVTNGSDHFTRDILLWRWSPPCNRPGDRPVRVFMSVWPYQIDLIIVSKTYGISSKSVCTSEWTKSLSITRVLSLLLTIGKQMQKPEMMKDNMDIKLW